tara:strand:+ start:2604 stop:2798 length:195 start_codon:yes stop_codon:yes gene_type:complete
VNEMETKTVEELHTMTQDEISTYIRKLYAKVGVARTIAEYREKIGDDNNPYLLEAKNITEEGLE